MHPSSGPTTIDWLKSVTRINTQTDWLTTGPRSFDRWDLWLLLGIACAVTPPGNIWGRKRPNVRSQPYVEVSVALSSIVFLVRNPDPGTVGQQSRGLLPPECSMDGQT